MGQRPERIAIVVPCSRPHLLPRVMAMAEWQTNQDHLLIPIEGDARPGIARNAGMAEARRLGFQLVSFWDDDDFYGPGFLEEQLANWRPGRVVGKTFGFVAFNLGVVYFTLPKGGPSNHLLIGGSIMGSLDELPDWTDLPIAEDGRFTADCRRRGLETYVLSGRHFVYSRLGSNMEHTYKAKDALVWLTAGDQGIPTNMTPEAAMVADVPTGQGILHKAWLETLR